MTSGKTYLFVFLSLLLFIIAACEDEKGKGDYSGVSELISERNKARQGLLQKTPENKTVSNIKQPGQTSPAAHQEADQKKEEISSIVLYEQEIEIVGAQSKRKLARGIAYINKEGQIIRIKIIRE